MSKSLGAAAKFGTEPSLERIDVATNCSKPIPMNTQDLDLRNSRISKSVDRKVE